MEILLDIKNQYLRQYLNFLFEKAGKNGFAVNRHCSFGSLLCAYAKRSQMPVQHEITENTVTFILPKSKNMEQNAERYYMYYDKFDSLRLNDVLKIEFNLDFFQFYRQGIASDFQQKEVIDSYIIVRNLSIDSFDVLKKRVYRSEIENQQKLRKTLLNKAQYIERKSKKSVAQIINDCISNE